MFLRVTRKKYGNRIHEYAQIAEHKIVNHRQKTIVLKHLGPVRNADDKERYRRIFDLERESEEVRRFKPSDLKLLPSLNFGILYASRKLMEEHGLMKVLAEHTGEYTDVIFLMIVSRLVDPSSDLSLMEFNRNSYSDNPVNTEQSRIYRALDRLISKKDQIEIGIFHALKPDISTVHYDLTSSYFEGREDNDLVLFGYSRDKKRGKEQIVIGMVMADGIPIHHEVWPGNTVDPKTLESTIATLKDRFHIRNFIFIADRAFGSNTSLELLDHNLYITAAYRWDMPYRRIITETVFDDSDLIGDLFMKEVTLDAADLSHGGITQEEKAFIMKRRHIMVYNRKREVLDLRDLEEKIRIVRDKIREIKDTDDLKKSLGKLRSLVKFTKHGVMMNQKRISMLKSLAGRFMIITNTDLPIREVVNSYKDQWKIERSFRTIKSFLEIRPVNHRKSERIRAHVFICVLSLLLSNMMEKQTGMTIERTTRDLSELKVIPVKLTNGIVMIRTESDRAEKVLVKLGVEYPKNVVKNIPDI
ncbi:MAG: IS1634 family transposase [Thermoplasmata archaeon]